MGQNNRTVLVAGAAGNLGAEIAARVIDAGGAARLLLRERKPADVKKAALIDSLVRRGAEIALGDVVDAASLAAATKNVATVVSALQGGFDVIVQGQVALARAAAGNGARRFIPSDFSVDFFKLPDGSHPHLDLRRAAARELAALPIETTHIFNGGFMEVVFAPFFEVIDVDNASVRFFGDASQSLDVTAMSDVGRFTAAAALEEAPIPGPLGVVGDVATPSRLAAILTKLSGRTFELVRRGGIDDLERWIGAEQAAGRGSAWPTIGAQYAWAMMSGKARVANPVTELYLPSALTAEAFLAARVGA